MVKIVPIGEGNGERKAAQVLCTKILVHLNRTDIEVDESAIANGKGNITKVGGIEALVMNAFTRDYCGAVIVFVDADRECPLKLSNDLARRIDGIDPLFPVAVVVAKCAYENWFLASLDSIIGQMWGNRPGIPLHANYTGDVELRCDVKHWLKTQLPENQIYKETTDQEAITKLIDVDMAKKNSRSFRRLCHAVEQMLAAIDSGEIIVTPLPKG